MSYSVSSAWFIPQWQYYAFLGTQQNTRSYKLEKNDTWTAWTQMVGENTRKDSGSNMDLIWDLSSGKSWFFFLATGARQLKRKQSITCANTICFNGRAFFLATLSYLKIIGRSYVFFRSPVERSFKNPFQCLSIRLQSSCHSAAALCFFLKYFCGNL